MFVLSALLSLTFFYYLLGYIARTVGHFCCESFLTLKYTTEFQKHHQFALDLVVGSTLNIFYCCAFCLYIWLPHWVCCMYWIVVLKLLNLLSSIEGC